MDFLKKENSCQTSQTFSPRVPLSQRVSQNLPFVSQIQQLMATLVQKKSQLKESKLRQANLVGKEQQQEIRISKVKIAMDHQIQKQQLLRNQQDKIQQQINTCKQSIKELTKNVKTAKGQLSQVLQDIISGKKNKYDLEKICSQLEYLIQSKTEENSKMDQQVQNLQTIILSSQNDVRSKQDQLTNLQLQRTQLMSLYNYLEQRIKLAVKAKNCSQAQGNQLSQQITKSEQKLYNIKKQVGQIDWNCQQIKAQNNQIQQLNQKLALDLQGVCKHLATMEKMNQLLQNSIMQYGITGDKVTRMIAAAKTI